MTAVAATKGIVVPCIEQITAIATLPKKKASDLGLGDLLRAQREQGEDGEQTEAGSDAE
jgi:hypothetical protein